MRLRMGPLSSEGARAWTTDTLALLDALQSCADLPFSLPDEMVSLYRTILERMHDLAEGTTEFFWECDTTLEDLKPVVTYWVNIGNLTDAAVEALGGQWSRPAGEAFHSELLRSLLTQLEESEPVFAARLRTTWSGPRNADNAATAGGARTPSPA